MNIQDVYMLTYYLCHGCSPQVCGGTYITLAIEKYIRCFPLILGIKNYLYQRSNHEDGKTVSLVFSSYGMWWYSTKYLQIQFDIENSKMDTLMIRWKTLMSKQNWLGQSIEMILQENIKDRVHL